MNDNQTLDVTQGETTPSESSTDIKVPGQETVETSEKTQTTDETQSVDATTVKPGSEGDEAPRSRAAQRIGELVRRNRELEEQLNKDKTGQTGTAPTTVSTTDTPELQKAKNFLKELGYLPQHEVQNQIRDEIENLEARIVIDTENQRLESIYNGEDGRPKYDRDKIMEFAKNRAIYDPEVAYKVMFEKELTDWAIKQAIKAGSTNTFKEKPSSTSTGDSGQIDRNALARILGTPDGRKWYEDNRDKVMSALQKGEL